MGTPVVIEQVSLRYTKTYDQSLWWVHDTATGNLVSCSTEEMANKYIHMQEAVHNEASY